MGGAVVSVLSVLLIAWVIGSVLVASPFSGVVSQVNNSAVLRTTDRLMPTPALTMFSDFRRLLASGPFPEVFSGIGAAHVLSVAPPDGAVLDSAGFLAARSRVVKIKGTASSCSRIIEGSGFVYVPDHIITNAHVVAVITQGPQVFAENGAVYQATVVFDDPQVDIAILYVPGLDMTPLEFAGQAQIGADAVVAGYPLDHAFTAVPARVGGMQDATGADIYLVDQPGHPADLPGEGQCRAGQLGWPAHRAEPERLRGRVRGGRRRSRHRLRAHRRRGLRGRACGQHRDRSGVHRRVRLVGAGPWPVRSEAAAAARPGGSEPGRRG